MLIYKSDSPEEFLRYDRAKIVVVPVPYEKTTSYGKGTVNGPAGICEASAQVELYDEELGFEPYNIGIATIEQVKTLDKLEKRAGDILKDKKIPFSLGGEHTISAAPIRACKKLYKNLSVIHFDAHADLRDEFEGTPLNHACVMRRVHEAGVGIVQVGIRNHSLEEADFMKKAKLNRPFYAHEIYNSDYWMEEALKLLTDDVYLSFDVDAFDPSIMPSTGTPEPGGMNWYQVVNFFKMLAKEKNIVGADFVELAPRKGDNGPDFTIAKLIYKLIGYIAKNDRVAAFRLR